MGYDYKARIRLWQAFLATPGVLSMRPYQTYYPNVDIAIIPYEDFRGDVALTGLLRTLRELSWSYEQCGWFCGVARDDHAPFLFWWERKHRR